ncbi:uncharacterized protein M6B38_270855 [Iris pallida]|uniref:Uncharacterized protein n=1 Tax=Iris pallida TaxID=29817 RepID=A0AAX6I789_IRIPA|nr:uncharacterized protein M6B38_270855 [Iris pallida]
MMAVPEEDDVAAWVQSESMVGLDGKEEDVAGDDVVDGRGGKGLGLGFWFWFLFVSLCRTHERGFWMDGVRYVGHGIWFVILLE